VKTNKMIDLSTQQLIDCIPGSSGCNGLDIDLVYKYLETAPGIDSSACYPYNARQNTCQYKQSCCVTRVTKVNDLAPNEDALQVGVYANPVVVGVDASQVSFQFYSSGVYYEPGCTDNIDHLLLVVGWGTMNGQEYWIAKNSWGSSWGMQGYILMSRNRDNNCGIASFAKYPSCTACS